MRPLGRRYSFDSRLNMRRTFWARGSMVMVPQLIAKSLEKWRDRAVVIFDVELRGGLPDGWVIMVFFTWIVWV